MQLSTAVLRWIIKRALTFAFIVLVLFSGYLLIMWAVPEFTTVAQTEEQLAQVREDRAATEAKLKAAEDEYSEDVKEDKDQTLDALKESVGKDVKSLGQEVEEQKNKVASLRKDLCDDWAKFWEDTWGNFGAPKPCAAAADAVRRAEASHNRLTEKLDAATGQLETLLDPKLTPDEKIETVGRSLDEFVDPLIENRIADLEQEIDALGVEEASLLRAQDSWVWFVIVQWRERGMFLVGAALAILLARPLARIFNYFVAMPLVTRVAKPVRLSVGEAAARVC